MGGRGYFFQYIDPWREVDEKYAIPWSLPERGCDLRGLEVSGRSGEGSILQKQAGCNWEICGFLI